MGWKSSGVDRFDLGPLFQGQMRIAELKSVYNSLIVGPRGLQCETKLQEIMSCEFSDVFRFELGPLFQGQMRIAELKSVYNALIIGLQVWDGKPTYRKSGAGNLLVWSDLTLDHSFKVK